MIQAMGGKLTDGDGNEIAKGGIALTDLADIDVSGLDPRMADVNVVIDGKETSGPSGMTILEAANEAGINIPTLCHRPDLTPDGNNRRTPHRSRPRRDAAQER